MCCQDHEWEQGCLRYPRSAKAKLSQAKGVTHKLMVFLIALLLLAAVVGYISSPFFLKGQILEQRYPQEELENIGNTIEQELIKLQHDVNETFEEISSK